MRFIGVLLGSLVASAVLVGAWVWTGATAGMERQACPQTAAAAIAVVPAIEDLAPATSVGRSADLFIPAKPGSSEYADAASTAAASGEGSSADSESQAGFAEDSAETGTPAAEAVAQIQSQDDTWQVSSRDDADAPAATTVVRDAATETETQSSVHWHSFWQPFTSAVSARGFAARLEQLTGLDFQVRRAGVGEYEVAFSHLDDRQRQAHLERIQTVTGLELERQEQEP